VHYFNQAAGYFKIGIVFCRLCRFRLFLLYKFINAFGKALEGYWFQQVVDGVELKAGNSVLG